MWKAILVHLRIGCISTMPCGHLIVFHPFSPQIYLFLITPGPLQYSNGGPLISRTHHKKEALRVGLCFIFRVIVTAAQNGQMAAILSMVDVHHLTPTSSIIFQVQTRTTVNTRVFNAIPPFKQFSILKQW